MSLEKHIRYIEQDILNKRDHQNFVWVGACNTMDEMYDDPINGIQGYLGNSEGDKALMKEVFDHFHENNYTTKIVKEVVPWISSTSPVLSTLLTWQ